jgi:hypothetical protein
MRLENILLWYSISSSRGPPAGARSSFSSRGAALAAKSSLVVGARIVRAKVPGPLVDVFAGPSAYGGRGRVDVALANL